MAPLKITELTVGAKVSMLIEGVVPALPLLPGASWYEFAVTVMLALPLAKLLLGVNVADLLRPLPLMAPKMPPVTTISPALPFQLKLLPGSSVNVKVMVAVSPIFKALLLDAIATEGAKVSMLIAGVAPAPPGLLAASW